MNCDSSFSSFYQSWINFVLSTRFMKHLIISCLAATFLLGLAQKTAAQDPYLHSIGLRAGNLGGLTYKRFFTDQHAVEGIAGFNFQNGRIFSLTGLYEYHIFISYELNFYLGAGLTLGGNSNEFRFLGEAIAGLEYTLPNFPISIGADFKPAFFFFGDDLLQYEYALTVRYIL